jgi:branched-chain amino acid transport system ATP-binding protein
MLLEIKNLAKNFGGVSAVKDVSLKADSDEIVSVIGPNGAGKTTLFNLISGIYRADAGEILFEGENLVGKPQHLIAKKGISRTFQNIRLFRGLTVMENVMTPLDAAGRYSIFSAMLMTPAKFRADRQSRLRAMEALDTVGMASLGGEQPSNLPYGLQRRVELARAIVTGPKLLMLDEPAAGLNPSEVRDFIRLVAQLREKFHFGILVIEHRMQVVNELSKRVYVVNFGNLLACGSPREIIGNPDVIRAYIGEEGSGC